MTHYDDYPYPSPTEHTPEEAKQLYTDFAPRAETWEKFWPGEKPAKKRALVIGCGVYEAVAVAAQEPLLEVDAMDVAFRVIEIAQKMAEGLKNISFMNADFMKHPIHRHYDFVQAGGVMHHVEDADGFMQRVGYALKPGGLFSVMVYGDYERSCIPGFRDALKILDVERNAEGIAVTRHLMATMNFQHPIRKFYRRVNDNDSQIVDMFLHPYAKQYSAQELVELVEAHGLRLQRWLNDATNYQPINLSSFPRYADRWKKLSEAERCRIGQIMGHRDAKLAALFNKPKE